MSKIHSIYPPDHPVFQGGRYLAAFASLDDIDYYELSILQYLASKMPFDKGFVGKVAFPSIATISRSTKIPESTVRKKIKSLVTKGYVIKQERRIINEQGRWQQLTNDYYLTEKAFEVYESVMQSKKEIANTRKRAVGESFYENTSPSHVDSPPLNTQVSGSYTSDNDPIQVVATNSPSISPEEDPNIPPNSCKQHNAKKRKSEIDEIILCWEELIKKTVNSFERKRFYQEYVRTRCNPILLAEKLKQIESDPYLFSRAKSMNWLFSGFDMAVKNRGEIVKIGRRAIQNADTSDNLKEVESKLPGLIERNADGFIEVTPTIVDSLFGDALAEAKMRFGGKPGKPRARIHNIDQLKIEIRRKLAGQQSEAVASRLRSILEMAETTSFATVLDLYVKTEVK
ncbi:MAG: hypothetical protein HRU19_30190 [Pseudobacteriovorax sp.]|nr:hypothetical protein [Pseudobacteriovorax sp.]